MARMDSWRLLDTDIHKKFAEGRGYTTWYVMGGGCYFIDMRNKICV
jgi:hypothetical protein